jgi:hypothetical protein
MKKTLVTSIIAEVAAQILFESENNATTADHAGMKVTHLVHKGNEVILIQGSRDEFLLVQ